MHKKKYVLLFLLSILSKTLFAQEDKRYLAFSLVNLEHRNPQLADINKAADLGMNAFIISIRKDVILGKKVSATNPWKQYDDQIATARSRGMKICFRIVFAMTGGPWSCIRPAWPGTPGCSPIR